MHKIVLSYRRSDAEVIAGRIHDKLVAHYGREAIFMDIDTIPFGMDFRKHIRDALAETDLLLAIISPQWAGEGERRRIDEQNDYVRLEIETALQRNIPVIPVLVSHATMPSPNDLPESLAELVFRQAIAIDSGRDFHPHADRLIRSMDGHLAEIRQRAEQAQPAREVEEEARQRAEQERLAQEEEAQRRDEQERLAREAAERATQLSPNYVPSPKTLSLKRPEKTERKSFPGSLRPRIRSGNSPVRLSAAPFAPGRSACSLKIPEFEELETMAR